MVTKLSQETQKILGIKPKSNLGVSALAVVTEIVTERVDDIGVLIGQMVKMELPEVLDNHIPKHWKQFKLGMDNCYLVSLHIE